MNLQSESVKNVVAALLVAKQSIVNPTKDAKANYGKYVTINAVLDTITPALTHEGLLVTQSTTPVDGVQYLVTTIYHVDSGEWLRGFFELAVKDRDSGDPQKLGSAVTYARRYALLAFLGLGAEDDDGQAASQPKRRPTEKVASDPPASNKGSDDGEPIGSDNIEALVAILKRNGVSENDSGIVPWVRETLGLEKIQLADLTKGQGRELISTARKQARERGEE